MEIKPDFVTYEDEKIYNNISIWKIEKINMDSTLNELENNGKYKNVYLKNSYEELKLAIKIIMMLVKMRFIQLKIIIYLFL